MENQGKWLLHFMKMSAKSTELNTAPLCIPVGNPVIAFLRPVAVQSSSLNPQDVALLTAWRNKYVTSFLTEFEATTEQTSAWLMDIVAKKDNKILFMLDNLQGQTFGYMGLDYINWETGYGEADAIVKGEEAPKGVMTMSLETLLAWGVSMLGLKELHVRVLEDNPALNFYKNMGFLPYKYMPLIEQKTAHQTTWVEMPIHTDSKRKLVYLQKKLG